MTTETARTKIIATIGPATQEIETLCQLIDAGLDAFRLNFSHGSHIVHEKTIRNIRKACLERGVELPVILDLCGPKLRIGEIPEPFMVTAGDRIVITTEDIPGTKERIATSYKALPSDVKPGDRILIDDGLIELTVETTEGTDVTCVVRNGGLVKSNKGMNLPGAKLSTPSITEKDRQDVKFGVERGVDFIALSFVRSHTDIIELQSLLRKLDSRIPVIAKIEKPEAIQDIENIIATADAVMVARGDLGVEMATEDVPILQKMIIRRCNAHNKPVITATQMLESMIHNPRPTRAEASDVANAVFDGTDAVMLSAETSVGDHPVAAVRIMNSIVRRAERQINPMHRMRKDDIPGLSRDDFGIIMSRAACAIAEDTEASAIFAITKSGRTARLLSKYRIQTPIFAFTGARSVVRELAIVWGVNGVLLEGMTDTDSSLKMVTDLSLRMGYAKEGENVVFVAGIPLLQTNKVNMIKVEEL